MIEERITRSSCVYMRMCGRWTALGNRCTIHNRHYMRLMMMMAMMMMISSIDVMFNVNACIMTSTRRTMASTLGSGSSACLPVFPPACLLHVRRAAGVGKTVQGLHENRFKVFRLPTDEYLFELGGNRNYLATSCGCSL